MDKRFHFFTTQVPVESFRSCAILLTSGQVLPGVLKSAVRSANTVIFVPSSFDFIRVHNYFRKTAGLSFTVLSE